MKLIGLIAGKRCGKDTFADYVIKKNNYVKYGFADPLKEACRHLFVFNDEQLYGECKEDFDERWETTPRKIYQQVGTEMFRNYFQTLFPENKNLKGGNFWVYRFKLWYQEELKKNPELKVIISDIRFQNEADIISELGGTLIKIERDTKMVDTHISEANIHKIKSKYTITNDSTLDDYYNKIDSLMGILKPQPKLTKKEKMKKRVLLFGRRHSTSMIKRSKTT